jgi:hypothetical protein
MKKIIFLLMLLCTIAILGKSKKDSKSILAIYENATVYTSYTLYSFKDAKTGKKIEINSTSEFVDAELAKKVVVPKDLLEDPTKIEGLPGANPKLVGKKFNIQYLPNDKIIVKKAI